jgi:DNA mismatch endonuclease (patch repair protein)
LDTFTKAQRRKCMSNIKSKNTKPETAVRKILYSLGFRYRLHKKDLPGRPDIVLTKKKIIFFVNGCFWHQHKGCKRNFTPKSNTDYWESKLNRNTDRQNRVVKSLENMGWKVYLIWECETKDNNFLEKKLKGFLNG